MDWNSSIIKLQVEDVRIFNYKNNGILIERDINELVKAIEKLYLDKDLRERLGNYAYSYVRENHTIEKMAKYYVNLFDKTSNKYVN